MGEVIYYWFDIAETLRKWCGGFDDVPLYIKELYDEEANLVWWR